MLTKDDLALYDEYLDALVEDSRLTDMSPPKIRTKPTKDTNEESAAFTPITQLAFPLQCMCGFRWTYKARTYANAA